MGSNTSQLTEEELNEYKELTYLSRKEIIHIFNIFKKIDPTLIQGNKSGRIPFEQFCQKIAEFEFNPFNDRLCQIFSSNSDGRLSFEDFLDLMSILSSGAPLKKKAEYAFRIFDFDDDGLLSREDVKEVVIRLTGNDGIKENSMDELLNRVFSEADHDSDGYLSFNEFLHVVSKSSTDFLSSFHLQL